MADGLKLVVSADTKEATAAVNQFANDAGTAGTKAGVAMQRGLNPALATIQKIPATAKPAIAAISKLGDTVETLQGKLGARKSFLITETDIGKVAVLNAEIRDLEQEIARIKNVGAPGFDSLGNAMAATVNPVQAVAGGVGTAYGALRKLAFLIPGIGIGGLVSLLGEAVVSLFKTSDALDQTAISAAKFAIDIREAKEGVEEFVKSLDFTSDLDKLRNKLKFGDTAKTDLLNFKVDKGKADAIIKQADAEITQITDRIGQLTANSAFILSKKGQELLNSFSNELDIPDDQISKLSKSDEAILREIKVDATRRKELEDQRLKASIDVQKQELESQIKANEDQKKASDKALKDLINRAKQTAAFLDKNTQFNVSFDLDPQLSEAQQGQSAKKFLNKVKDFFDNTSAKSGTFKFKTLVEVAPEFKKVPEAFLNALPTEISGGGPQLLESFDKIKKDFETNLQKLADRNPITVQFRTQEQAKTPEINRQATIASQLGLQIQEINTPKKQSFLKQTDEDAVRLANTMKGILIPSFNDLVSAVESGENPLKAFFKGIGDAVSQLIQKLIAAAVEALILSAIFPGGIGGVKGFGGFFKNITGFASGGIVSGPTLAMVGEGFSTSRSNPEVVAPLDQLKNILSGMNIGGGQQVVILRSAIRGNNLALIQDRTARRNGRFGA